MSVRYTTESYAKRVKEETGGEYEVLGEYVSVHTYMEYYHTVCGHTTSIRPVEFFNAKHNTRCSYCLHNKIQSKSPQWFEDKVKELVGDEYSILTPYTRAKNKISMRHNKCGWEWKVTPDNFLRRNSRCPLCNHNARLTTEQYKNYIKRVTLGKYELIGEYKNARTKVKIKHLKCGHITEIVAENAKLGICHYCSGSQGEKATADILDELGIEYITQYTIQEVKYKNLLRFDFYLPTIGAFIEYDGKQHYEPVNFGDSSQEDIKNQFEANKFRDSIKDKYCLNNNLLLIRVPYWLSNKEEMDLIQSRISI